MSHSATSPPPRRTVTLCDASGRPLSTADILSAHTGEGLLHLAFSVYVFNPARQALLIQQRSRHKMLWPLVWANTCCSHPREGEGPVEAAGRRLREEMGFTCDLTPGSAFVYRAIDPDNRGVEHEYDVTLWGTYDHDPEPDPAEVAAWRWVGLGELRRDMRAEPGRYAPWFHLGLERVVEGLPLAARRAE